MKKDENTALYTTKTKHEIKFIQSIGHQQVPATARFSRVKLLQGYLQGCQKRERWDNIDPLQVMAAAKAEIANENAKLKRIK